MCDSLAFCKRLRGIDFELDCDAKKYCTFGIGGKVKIIVKPSSVSQLVKAVCASGGKAIVIGNGSNILFSDAGVSRPIITTKFIKDEIMFNGNLVTVNAGCSLSKFIIECAKRGFGGCEKLFGIPATIGGALYMNAGALGCEISNKLSSVKVLQGMDVKRLNKNELAFGYRKSPFMDLNATILEATFLLDEKATFDIEEQIKSAMFWRQEHQPAGKSAGSVFKKAVEPAGYLIDQCGLKGMRVGGAVVSNKHANFIVNSGNALAKDVLELICIIKNKVYQDYKILLEEEILYIGDNNETNGGFSHTF